MFTISRIFFLIIGISLVLSTPQSRISTQFDDIQNVMMDLVTSPIVHLLLIYDSDTMKAPIAEMMDNFAEKRKGYLEVKIIDCNTQDQKVLTEFAYCQQQTRKQLPALVFSEPHLNLQNDGQISEPRVRPYQGALEQKKLFNFAVPLMPIYSIELKNARDLKKFETSYKQTPKIIYFSDKEKIPPFYRALTANFRNSIAFAHCFSKSALTQHFKITQFPTFMLIGAGQDPQVLPIEKDLSKMIQRLRAIEGQQTQIYIQQYQTSKIIEITEQNLDTLVYKQQQTILIHAPDSEGNDHKEWGTIMKKFKKMFKFYEINSAELRKKLGIKQVPALVYFPRSLVKKDIQKTIFYSSETFQNIYQEIDHLIDDFTVPLADQIEMQKLISIHLQDQRLVAILFHDKQRSLPYKVISNDDHLEQHIAFFRMKDPKQAVLEQFQIKKLPALIMLMQDKEAQEKVEVSQEEKEQGKQGFNLKIAQYTGQFNYYDLFSYFSNFVKMPNQEPKFTDEEAAIELDSQLIEITSPKIFKKTCLSQGCYLLIVNNLPSNRQKTQQNLQTLMKQAQKVQPSPSTQFAYLDGMCHSEILGALEIYEDQMPALVYINSKFEKYSRMIGRLQSQSIRNFISKVKTNKASYRGYDKLKLTDKNCVQEHQKMQKLTEQNVELSAEEAAILEQLKQKDKMKQNQFKQSVQKDRVRKKGKKRRPKRDYQEQL